MAPRLLRGVSCGHDFDFHLVSWFEVARSWKQGLLYPHWAETPNWGAGEPRFIFYPPLTWAMGAAFGALSQWTWVSGAMVYVILAATGITTRWLARQFLSPAHATLAGILAALSPYALFTAYERTAFGELAAAAWIPLLLLFAWRRSGRQFGWLSDSQTPAVATDPAKIFHAAKQGLLAQAFDGSAAPLAIVLAATWLTNAPAGVMASYLLAFAAVSAALLLRSWWPILRAAAATLLGLGLAAFYLVPAAWEQRWIAIDQAVDVGERIRDSWLFARHPGPDLALHDQVLLYASTILTFTAAVALIGFAISFWRRKLTRETRHFWLPLALLIPGIFLLQLPVSALIWNLPKLQFLQFPWRWLTVLDLPFAIFLAAATPFRTWRSRTAAVLGWSVFIFAIVGIASMNFWQFCDDEDSVHGQLISFQSDSGVEGTDEYAARGSDNSLIASNLPQACLVTDPTQELGEGDTNSDPVWYPEQGSCDQTFTARLWQTEHRLLDIDSDHDGYLILRLRRYPAWLVTVNNRVLPQQTTSIPLRDDGLIVVPVNAGTNTIEVRWTTTPDIRWGRSISILSLLLLIALGIAELLLKPRRIGWGLSWN